MSLSAQEVGSLWGQIEESKCWITWDGFNLRCLWGRLTCVSVDSPWSLPWGHQEFRDGKAEWPLTVQAGLALVVEGKRHNTYKNFPFVFDPIRTICSDSSREIFPWNQGIFSWAVVAISFSSWGFWLMMACSRAWPCHEERRWSHNKWKW